MNRGNTTWVDCPDCGNPRLQLDHDLTPEACGNCRSLASRLPTYLGSYWIGLLGIVVVALLACGVFLIL